MRLRLVSVTVISLLSLLHMLLLNMITTAFIKLNVLLIQFHLCCRKGH